MCQSSSVALTRNKVPVIAEVEVHLEQMPRSRVAQATGGWSGSHKQVHHTLTSNNCWPVLTVQQPAGSHRGLVCQSGNPNVHPNLCDWVQHACYIKLAGHCTALQSKQARLLNSVTLH